MRVLICIPMVDVAPDSGLPAEALSPAHGRGGEGRGRRRTRRLMEAAWDGIRERLLALELDYRRVRLYQGGLPVCGREAELVRVGARLGGPSYALLSELVDRGALVEGTESLGLLQEECRRLRCPRGGPGAPGAGWPEASGREGAGGTPSSEGLLQQRDQFMAWRIDETLREGEVGVLLIGLRHQVEKFLPPDIVVRYLIHRLPFHLSPGPPCPWGVMGAEGG